MKEVGSALFVLITLVVVGFYLKDRFLSSASRSATPSFPYRRQKYLLTKAELAFYRVLRDVLRHHALDLTICLKVRLADLIAVEKGTDKRQSHFNRIQSKHVDFLLVDQNTITPVIAIELDDQSHQRDDRRQRDSFLDQALTSAGLPFLRIPAARAYDSRQLAESIREKLPQLAA